MRVNTTPARVAQSIQRHLPLALPICLAATFAAVGVSLRNAYVARAHVRRLHTVIGNSPDSDKAGQATAALQQSAAQKMSTGTQQHRANYGATGGGAAPAEGGGEGLAPGQPPGPGSGGGGPRVAPGMTALLRGLVERGTLRSERVAAAMAAVDRAAFIAPGHGGVAVHVYEVRGGEGMGGGTAGSRGGGWGAVRVWRGAGARRKVLRKSGGDSAGGWVEVDD